MAEPKPRPRRRRRSPLGWCADLVVGHPRLVIAVWFSVLGILAMQGLDLPEKVSSSPVFVDGTEPEHEHKIAAREFGTDSALIVMLRGPEAEVTRQGRQLVRNLDRVPEVLVNSPWAAEQVIDGLNPEPGVAGLVVNIGKQGGLTSRESVLRVEKVVYRTVSPPVRISIAGGLPLAYALRGSIEDAAKTGEMLAIPALLIVLLFVCRSLIAAAMPVFVGAMVVAATKGILDLCVGLVRIDSFALAAAGMLGLALGVDYALLVVSRFREELERNDDMGAAMQRTVRATGRSIIPAGCGLVLAMVVSSQILPSAVISSVALAVTTASVLSVLSAILATPAILMVVGKHLDRWSLPKRRSDTTFAMRWTQRVSSRPGMVILVGLVLFACSAWAFTLKTQIGAIDELPPTNASRIQHEDVQSELGPGWVAPIEVVMDSKDGPVTTERRLRALTDFQEEVEADPGVATMAGFDSLARGAEQFAEVGPGLDKQQRGIVRVSTGLAKVARGSASSSSGLAGASEGARQLDSAIDETYKGSGQIADGLRSTAAGSEKLNDGLDRADSGGGDLAAGATRSSNGAARMADALKKAQEQAGESSGSSRVLRNALDSGDQALAGLNETVRLSEDQLGAAQAALQRMTSGRTDPQFAAALNAVEEARKELSGSPSGEEVDAATGTKARIEKAQGQFGLGLYLAAKIAKNGRESERGIGRLAEASQKLDHGLRRLAASSEDLADGIAKLSDGGEQLSPGLRKLTDSAERLTGGLGEIGSGASKLAGGLDQGVAGSGQLSDALDKLSGGADRLAGPNDEGQFAELDRKSPGLFDSGYFVLAGLDGGSADKQDEAGFLINLGKGGSTARMMIVPSDDPKTGEAKETRERLLGYTAKLARDGDAEVAMGGVTPAVLDLDADLRSQAPLARLVLSLVTILILLFVTRSLVLPLIAAALNLITVSATFGLLSLLFDGSLLGGPGYIDTVIVPASIILVFGLAIDYEVFIFARMREEYLRTGSNEEAVSEGLGRSANVVTGAALIMISVFLVFAISPLSTLRAFGVGLAIAVFIDAFLVRFVIIPATMRALGERSWWMPRWLDRLLPGGGRPTVTAEAK